MGYATMINEKGNDVNQFNCNFMDSRRIPALGVHAVYQQLFELHHYPSEKGQILKEKTNKS